MNGMNYSIIIPHFSVPDLLLRCLKSIPCREDTEVIVVDDCSKDFEEQKERLCRASGGLHISFYSTKINSGPGAARNIGLEHAVGRWVIFEDADDFFTDELDSALTACADREADILFFYGSSVMSCDTGKPSEEYVYSDLFEKYRKDRDDTELRYLYYSVCGRMIRRSFIEENHLRFNERYHGEDVIFSVQMGHLCRSVDVYPCCLNRVTYRPGSLSRSWNSWSEWYRQFFPAHIEALHYLHRYRLYTLDAPVYSKLLFIMKRDRHTFYEMFRLFTLRERVKYVSYLMKRLNVKVLRKAETKNENTSDR